MAKLRTETPNRGVQVVAEMLVNWQATRIVLAELERAEHPDILDRHGRAWRWKSHDTYSHDGTLAIPGEWIAGSNLPPEALANNWNYHRLCETCTANWSPEAKAKHAQNAIDQADYERLGWDGLQKLRASLCSPQ